MSISDKPSLNGISLEMPVLGHLLLGGGLSGALIRDIRLANGLAERGYEVHVFWVLDQTFADRLDTRIHQHWLFSGLRYYPFRPANGIARDLRDHLARRLGRLAPGSGRQEFFQKYSGAIDGFMRGLIRMACNAVADDPSLIARFADELKKHRISHVLSQFAVLCPWIIAAKEKHSLPIKYFPTFQGYELYANYAERCGLENDLYRTLNEVIKKADFPAVAVSEDYCQRICQDLSIERERLVAIPPGIEIPKRIEKSEAKQSLTRLFPNLESDLPLVTYLGRQDSEKGIDLLLYAAAMLRRRGMKIQLAIAGPTLFGDTCARNLRTLARNLRIEVLWGPMVSGETREHLYAASDVVVCPSIHREPFGMVAAEAMAHGTPVIVSDQGGVAAAITDGDKRGGLSFRAWDSGDLAEKLESLLTDENYRLSLGENAATVAKRFSVDAMVDRIIRHMSLPVMAQPALSKGWK